MNALEVLPDAWGLVIILLVNSLCIFQHASISQHLETERNDVSVKLIDPEARETTLSIAVISDPHLAEGPEPLTTFRRLLMGVKAAKPDVVVLVGDYIRDRVEGDLRSPRKYHQGDENR